MRLIYDHDQSPLWRPPCGCPRPVVVRHVRLRGIGMDQCLRCHALTLTPPEPRLAATLVEHLDELRAVLAVRPTIASRVVRRRCARMWGGRRAAVAVPTWVGGTTGRGPACPPRPAEVRAQVLQHASHRCAWCGAPATEIRRVSDERGLAAWCAFCDAWGLERVLGTAPPPSDFATLLARLGTLPA